MFRSGTVAHVAGAFRRLFRCPRGLSLGLRLSGPHCGLGVAESSRRGWGPLNQAHSSVVPRAPCFAITLVPQVSPRGHSAWFVFCWEAVPSLLWMAFFFQLSF